MRWPAALLALAAVPVIAYALWPVPEPERVRRAVEDAADAFSAGRAADCIDAFAPRFEDASGRRTVDRELIRAALMRGLVVGSRGPDWIARIGSDGVEVTACDTAAGRATARFEVELLRVPAGAEYVDGAEPVWRLAVDAELARGDDRAWRFVRSSHETLSGEPLYR